MKNNPGVIIILNYITSFKKDNRPSIFFYTLYKYIIYYYMYIIFRFYVFFDLFNTCKINS